MIQAGGEIRQREERRRRREWLIISLALPLLLVLFFAELVLTDVSAEVPLGNKVIVFGLINVIILLIILLIYLIVRNIAKLVVERAHNPLGTRLRGKLVLAFVGLSLVPTLLLFFTSAAYVRYSIKTWFDRQIEVSLKESLSVAEAYYQNSEDNALYYGGQISTFIKDQKLLNEQNLPLLRDLVKQKQQEYNLGVVEVYSAQREELVRVANPNVPMGGFTNPDSADINAALSGKSLTRISPAGKADLIRGIVPIHSNWNPTDVVGVVVVNYYVPYSLVGKVKEIKGSIRDFIRLKEMRRPVTTGYILTLFLITLVIIILAIGFGLHIAKTLTVPIQELAEATRKVAEGDLAVHLTPQRDDELGYLVQAFNRMTDDLRTNQQQLKVRTEEVISSNQELEERRRYMEIVLKNVTAGVISVDQNGTITTINTSAERLLGIEGDMVGRNFREVLRDHQLEMMRELLRDMLMNQQDALSKEVTVPLRDGKVTLLLNVTFMKDDNGEFLGTVVVFDDLSQLIKAQRMAAWREVARRIAHEIKNPLTPIQLSAQRLRRRYLERFGPDDRVFDDCTAMIIGSVEELKTLVNEFSNFARLPAAHPSPCSLNDLVREAVTLFSQAHRQVDFRLTLDELAPTLQLDRDQIKRVLINLLDNAVAAVEEEEEKRVDISTAFNRELKMVTLVVADTGHGIAVEDRAKLFEPYFSTKKTGTGLGLAIVNTIITDHQGFIRVRDNEPRGTRFIVELPVTT